MLECTRVAAGIYITYDVPASPGHPVLAPSFQVVPISILSSRCFFSSLPILSPPTLPRPKKPPPRPKQIPRTSNHDVISCLGQEMTQKHSKQNVDEQKSKETESCTAAAATLQSYKHLYVH